MGTKQPVTGLENRIAELEKENLLLPEKVAFLTRKLYGRSTEQTSSLDIEGQMSLFDEAETSTNPKAAEPDIRDVASYRRRSFPGQREELLKDIPHEKKLCTLAEEDRFCLTCNTPLVSVGEEFVRTELEFIPAKVRVIDYYRETFECRRFPIRSLHIPMHPHRQSPRASIRSMDLQCHYTGRRTNGVIGE